LNSYVFKSRLKEGSDGANDTRVWKIVPGACSGDMANTISCPIAAEQRCRRDVRWLS